MKTEFLAFDGQQDPAGQEDGAGGDSGEEPVEIHLTISRTDAEILLRVLDNLSWQLVQITGGVG